MAMGSEISKPIVCVNIASRSIAMHGLDIFYHSQCCKCQRILALPIAVKSVN